MVGRWEEVGGLGEEGVGIKKYRLVRHNIAMRCTVQHREYGQ